MYDKLTKKDILKIEEEIEYRKLVLRKELIDAVKEARAQGDLSENFEYYAAKREKNQNESRINYLERILRTASIIEDVGSDKVAVDNLVRVQFLDDNSVEEYILVTNIRGQSLNNKISITSPLGKAIHKKKKGDIVEVIIDDENSYKVKILDFTDNVEIDDSINKF